MCIRDSFYIEDRKKDLIICGGYNVYPREVEEVLARHPAVLEVTVAGVPDAKRGETVMAWIVKRPGFENVTSQELVKWSKAVSYTHLDVYKRQASFRSPFTS